MQLRRISIRNYKSIPPAGVELAFRSRLVALVGKNNAGKSNVLEAVGLLLGAKNPRYVGVDESYFHDPRQPIVIEVEWCTASYGDGKKLGLSDMQCHALVPKPRKGEERHPDAGRIVLRLRIPPVAMAESDAIEPDAEIEGDREEDAKRELVLLLGKGSEVRRVEPLRLRLARLISVPAVRSHTDLLSPSAWTSYGRLLRELLAGTPEAAQLEELIGEATRRLQDVLRTQSDQLTRAAKTTAFVDSIDFQFTKAGEASELLRNLTLAVAHGGRIDTIDDVGTGTQSAVILGVLELCLRHGSVAGSRIFAVEEPELFLHPHGQRRAGDLLRRIADEAGHYVILTTHSGQLLSSCDIFDVARLDRDAASGTVVRRLPSDFGDVDRAVRILTANSSEMLFADRVVLVEGPAEAILLPRLAKLVRGGDGLCDLDARNISVVAVEGKDAFGVFTRILESFGIEWRIVCDHDALAGSSISLFRQRAGLTGSETAETQIQRLRAIGVAVLRQGEIEDYYPIDALADIAASSPEEMKNRIEEQRETTGSPSGPAVLAHILRTRRRELGEAEDGRADKVSAALWSRSMKELREAGALPGRRRKTGEILASLLGPKPRIATRVASWFEQDSTRLTEPLTKLIQWAVSPRPEQPVEGSKP